MYYVIREITEESLKETKEDILCFVKKPIFIGLSLLALTFAYLDSYLSGLLILFLFTSMAISVQKDFYSYSSFFISGEIEKSKYSFIQVLLVLSISSFSYFLFQPSLEDLYNQPYPHDIYETKEERLNAIHENENYSIKQKNFLIKRETYKENKNKTKNKFKEVQQDINIENIQITQEEEKENVNYFGMILHSSIFLFFLSWIFYFVFMIIFSIFIFEKEDSKTAINLSKNFSIMHKMIPAENKRKLYYYYIGSILVLSSILVLGSQDFFPLLLWLNLVYAICGGFFYKNHLYTTTINKLVWFTA